MSVTKNVLNTYKPNWAKNLTVHTYFYWFLLWIFLNSLVNSSSSIYHPMANCLLWLIFVFNKQSQTKFSRMEFWNGDYKYGLWTWEVFFYTYTATALATSCLWWQFLALVPTAGGCLKQSPGVVAHLLHTHLSLWAHSEHRNTMQSSSCAAEMTRLMEFFAFWKFIA